MDSCWTPDSGVVATDGDRRGVSSLPSDLNFQVKLVAPDCLWLPLGWRLGLFISCT